MANSAAAAGAGSEMPIPDRRDGDLGWVYVADEFVQQHPLYGVYGWALFLMLVLFIGPLVLLWRDVSIMLSIYEAPDEAWFVLGVDIVLCCVCWVAGTRLATERESFQTMFFIAALVGVCSTLVFAAIMFQGLPPAYHATVWQSVIIRSLALLLSVPYVLQSQRINITTRKRTRADDPWLVDQWSSPQSFDDAAASDAEPPGIMGRMSQWFNEQLGGGGTSAVGQRATASRDPYAYYVGGGGAPAGDPAAGEAAPAARAPAGPALRREPVATPAAEAEPSRSEPAQPEVVQPELDDDIRLRLERLERAHEAGLITEDEYRQRRSEILATF